MNLNAQGYLSLILHAHLPYVRHADRDDVMEERWFFEAMTETYLPMLLMFDRLHRDRVPFRLTLSLSPPLLAMMDDSLMSERYTAYLNKLIQLSEREQERNQNQPEFAELAAMYTQRWTELLEYYQACGHRVIPKFRYYQDEGCIDIMTCSATHAFLPFLKHEVSIKAQLMVGVLEYERHFGRRPRGIWLPECAYTAECSPLLQAAGLQYFVVDSHGLEHASPKPSRALAAPVMTMHGIHAFARDPESSRQVWSSHEGYPGDPDYREYYRDIGYDLGWGDAEEWAYIKPYLLSNGARIHTGMKYYRISENEQDKMPYHPEWAQHKAAKHADHFLYCREQQIQNYQAHCDRKPLIVSPYDAELFGHWWYEGPLWIEALFRNPRSQQGTIAFITPEDYLREYPVSEEVDIPFCSWGRNGYAEVWLGQENDWIYRLLHQAEDRLLHTLQHHSTNLWGHTAVAERVLNQSIRELMLAQSSDWAFIMDAKTVPTYAAARTEHHLKQFHELIDMMEHRFYDVESLERMEHHAACLTSVHYELYTSALSSPPPMLLPDAYKADAGTPWRHRKVLMLAWEFPPLVIGGLAKAVFDLSRYLVDQRIEVHVITRSVQGTPSYERMKDIHVHRVHVLQTTTPVDFMDWVFQLNLAMTDYAVLLMESGHHFDFIHAHDWLVHYTAKDLKEYARTPLIATIHATEHGRNHGIIEHDVQRRIHQMETDLTAIADQVIVCSNAMVQEVQSLFTLPASKVSMIPNGVEIASLVPHSVERDYTSLRLQYAAPHNKILFYIGRLVYEKGIQVLIEALPLIHSSVPNTKLIIAGTGPMRAELEALAARLGLTSHVTFTGFIHDDTRNDLLQLADVCVFPSLYEPFGIVALEAMQSGTPVVVSDTGGLAEIIEHGVDGYKALPGHLESLAWHVTEVLLHPEIAKNMAANALRKVEQRYDWKSIAVSTKQVYEGVIMR
ncbi:1,4-alpha-glucan branching protein domain-containing protein [Paenibacillus guangzhouensis]|uniref:1,4-alpha-glucan branching protein domain-containing protein n=1 Tax=Paenibacillus guangzhouensis TaxID=1473112 RepID=UPI0012676EC8|nr:1,4-alpha-glucan branching protein domain-containing protein [Paenibacillus guangzhouensis]